MARLYKKYLDEFVSSGFAPTVYDDVHEFFKYLREKGKTIAVLSSHPSENLLQEARAYGLVDFISKIVSGSHYKVNDLKLLVNEFNVAFQQAVYFGDTVYDIRDAEKAGVTSVAVAGSHDLQRGYHSVKQLLGEYPIFLIDSLLDLID